MKLTSKETTIISIILMFSMIASSFFILPTVNAADMTITNYAYLVVTPTPVGVGQHLNVVMWLDKLPPISWGNANTNPNYDSLGDVFKGFTVQIVDPDGTNTVMGPYKSDYTGSYTVQYSPSKVGNYSFKFVYPGEVKDSIRASGQPRANDTYLAATSRTIVVSVTEEQIPDYPGVPLPTNYWERPIYGENREWAQLGGNWLGMPGLQFANGCNSTGAYNPYSTAPTSAHIMWTKQVGFGGIVGGATDNAFYSGLSYEESWNPPTVIILAGRIYMATRSDTNSMEGLSCLDLRTGEEIFFLNDTSAFSFGQLLNWQTMNEHGVLPYLWRTGSTMNVYNAWNGQFAFKIVNATTSSKYTNDENGNIIGYNVANNRLIKWNSTKAVYPSTSAITWSPSPTTNYSWANGIVYNVSVPESLGTMITASGGIVLFSANDFVAGVRRVNAFDEETGYHLYNINITDFNQRAQYNFTPVLDGYWAWYKQETKEYYGYNARTGELAWVSDAFPNDFAEYFTSYRGAGPSNPTVGYSTIFTTTYDGFIHANDIKNGTEIWSFSTGTSGYETPYGTYPFYGGPTVGGGAVFASSNEHTPNDPFWRGGQIWAVNATTGEEMWSISAWMPGTTLVDGYLSGVNYYDQKLYTFGKGLSATTTSATPKVTAAGTNILIEGTVTDQTPDANLKGTPAISDASMTPWMEYIFQQKPMPTNATGVPVTIDALDPNGNYIHIGDTTSDASGLYSYAWSTPDVPGAYTIYATFGGSNSYYASYSETAAIVSPAATPSPVPTQAPASVADMYFVPAIAGLFVLIIVVAIVLAMLMLRKRP